MKKLAVVFGLTALVGCGGGEGGPGPSRTGGDVGPGTGGTSAPGTGGRANSGSGGAEVPGSGGVGTGGAGTGGAGTGGHGTGGAATGGAGGRGTGGAPGTGGAGTGGAGTGGVGTGGAGIGGAATGGTPGTGGAATGGSPGTGGTGTGGAGTGGAGTGGAGTGGAPPLSPLPPGLHVDLTGSCSVSWYNVRSIGAGSCSATIVPTLSGAVSPLGGTMTISEIPDAGAATRMAHLELETYSRPSPTISVGFPGVNGGNWQEVDIALTPGSSSWSGNILYNGTCGGHCCNQSIPHDIRYILTVSSAGVVSLSLSGQLPNGPPPQGLSCWCNNANVSCSFSGRL
jgi:hypothetical protein